MGKITFLAELLPAASAAVAAEWKLASVQSGQCLSYVAWNTKYQEALVIDPKLEDQDSYLSIFRSLDAYVCLAVIDTHTHADHISCAAALSQQLRAPLVMHDLCPSQRVNLRVPYTTHLSSHAGPVRLILTPGHTPDALCVYWGPFLFTGDTILIEDTGRDDLPGGDAESHFRSIETLKAAVLAAAIVLPGHDELGRASTWGDQLEKSRSLKQSRADFVREASAFLGPAPQFLKESLKANFK